MAEPTNLSLGDAARAIGVSVDTLRRWDRDGKLETTRDAGNRRRVPATEARGDADLFGKFTEDRAALHIERAFSPLDLGPLAMSRHGMGM